MAEAKLSIGILGAGAIGTMLACLLEKVGAEVTCVVREDQVEALTKSGLTFVSERFGTVRANPRCESKLTHAVDALFVTVKSPYLKEALEEIPSSTVSHAVVVSLLNGIGAVETIRESIAPHALLGTIGSVEVEPEGLGKVKQIGAMTPHIEIAKSATDVSRISHMLSETGMTVDINKSEAEVLWSKLARLNAIASVTALSGKTVGEVRQDPELYERFTALVKEGIAIALKEGAMLDYDSILALTAKMPEAMTTSLQRDIAKGVPSELETITGGVVRRARALEVPCPVLEDTYERLRQKVSSGITSV